MRELAVVWSRRRRVVTLCGVDLRPCNKPFSLISGLPPSRRTARLREVLLGVFPGLEAALDFKREGALLAVTNVASPAAARRLGEARLRRWLKGRGVRKAQDLVHLQSRFRVVSYSNGHET